MIFLSYQSVELVRTRTFELHSIVTGIGAATGEKLPTDKLVDVSPLALRMSSPFNSGYWLAVA